MTTETSSSEKELSFTKFMLIFIISSISFVGFVFFITSSLKPRHPPKEIGSEDIVANSKLKKAVDESLCVRQAVQKLPLPIYWNTMNKVMDTCNTKENVIKDQREIISSK